MSLDCATRTALSSLVFRMRIIRTKSFVVVRDGNLTASDRLGHGGGEMIFVLCEYAVGVKINM